MAVPTMEESALCSQLIERVKDYHYKRQPMIYGRNIHDGIRSER